MFSHKQVHAWDGSQLLSQVHMQIFAVPGHTPGVFSL